MSAFFLEHNQQLKKIYPKSVLDRGRLMIMVDNVTLDLVCISSSHESFQQKANSKMLAEVQSV